MCFLLDWKREREGERGETYQTLEQAFACRGAARHHVPDLVFQLRELQPLLHFVRRHCFDTQTLASARVAAKGMDVRLPPGISCLLAKTSSRASFISRSRMILWSSCLASSIRARSLESMTKIRPCVPVPTLNQRVLHIPSH